VSAAHWVERHLAGSPPALREVMLAALPGEAAGVPEALAEGALTLYRAVLGGAGGREDALPLLAADALFTHALEAAAERDPAGLAEFAERWGPAGRLAELAAERAS
jgi:hypothetical protein